MAAGAAAEGVKQCRQAPELASSPFFLALQAHLSAHMVEEERMVLPRLAAVSVA